MHDGWSSSVTFSNIFLTKLEKGKIAPMKPKFYKRFVDDVITRRRIDQPDQWSGWSICSYHNTYHPNIKFTVEQSPSKFLDTNLKTDVENKIVTCTSKSKQITISLDLKGTKNATKRNAINGDLRRSYRIGIDFEYEKIKINEKFTNACFPVRFTKSVIEQFEEKMIQPDEDLLIPEFLFKEAKRFILVELPLCESNESLSKRFLDKIKFSHNLKWILW